MKLKNELQETILRLEKIKNKTITYAKQLKIKGEYKNFENRLLWDTIHAIYTSNELCGFYEKYNCNDEHIQTLGKQAFLQVFNVKNIEDILK